VGDPFAEALNGPRSYRHNRVGVADPVTPWRCVRAGSGRFPLLS
jgi:hypothetical protein